MLPPRLRQFSSMFRNLVKASPGPSLGADTAMPSIRFQNLRISNLRQATGKASYTIILTCLLVLGVSMATILQLSRMECATSTSRRQLKKTGVGGNSFDDDYVPLALGSVAVCVCGGAGLADLTAERLVSALPEWLGASRVRFFLSVARGKHVRKLAAFHAAGARVAAVGIQPSDLARNVSRAAREVLGIYMPQSGMDALLHSWSLVESCYDLVERDEAKRRDRFKWVMHVGMDQFWSGDTRLTPALIPGWSYLPLPVQRGGGYSGEAALWTREAAAAGMKRLTMLVEWHKMGIREASPKRLLKRWLEFQKPAVEVGFRPFPYCHISKELAAWPPGGAGSAAILPLGNAFAANGAKCRPCIAIATGDRAWKVLAEMEEGPIQVSVGQEPLGVCDASKPWSEGWQTVFDDVAGEKAAEIRQKFQERELDEPLEEWVTGCNVDLRSMKKSAARWVAPTVDAMCALTHLGAMQRVPAANGAWNLFPSLLDKDSTVYVFGLGPDIDFDKFIIERFKAKVHVFANTPTSMAFLSSHQDSQPPPQWVHHPFLLSTTDTDVQLKLPTPPSKATNQTANASAPAPDSDPDPNRISHVSLPARKLETLMKMNKHSKIDVLKIDIGGAEFDIISQWAAANTTPKACQVLIEFHSVSAPDGDQRRARAISDLDRLGFVFVGSYIDTANADHCLFAHPKFCLPPPRPSNTTTAA